MGLKIGDEAIAGGLIGMCFLARNESGAIVGMGQIMSSPGPGIFLVQTFSMATGEKDRFLQVVKVEQMARWLLFGAVEDMMECYSTATR